MDIAQMEQEALMEQTRGAVTEQAPGVAVDDVSERVRQQKIKHNQQKHVRHPVFGILLASFLISNHSLVHVLVHVVHAAHVGGCKYIAHRPLHKSATLNDFKVLSSSAELISYVW